MKAEAAWRGGPFEGRVHLVGGAVRDHLLGLPWTKDFDLVVEGDALAAAEALAEAGVAEGPPVVYSRFGTAMVRVMGAEIELASARRESYGAESRKPFVETGASLAEDALRRDFTVNALMQTLTTGEVQDPTGQGLSDLKDRVLRTPREPDATFSDDPLRMLRAVRFAARLDFSLAEGLPDAIRRNAHRLSIVSRERIRDELLGMSRRPSFPEAWELMAELDLLAAFAPELAAMRGVEQGDWHDLDAWGHTLRALRAVPDSVDLGSPDGQALVWGVLLHDIGKPPTRQVIDGKTRFFGHESVGANLAQSLLVRLSWPHKEAERIARLVAGHMRLTGALPLSSSAARRLLRDYGSDVWLLLDLIECDASALKPGVRRLDLSPVRDAVARAEAAHQEAPIRSPLSGQELMSLLNLAPGPEVGQAKRMLDEAVVEGHVLAGDPAGAAEWIETHWPNAHPKGPEGRNMEKLR